MFLYCLFILLIVATFFYDSAPIEYGHSQSTENQNDGADDFQIVHQMEYKP